MRTTMTAPMSTEAAALRSSTRVVIGVLSVRRTSRLPSGARVTVHSATGRKGRFVIGMHRPSRRAATDRMPPTLLIVDDHAAFRSTARALLECDGFNVVGEAGDGTSGLTAASGLTARPDLKPDVVLLDVRLPDIDGFSIAERLTAEGGGPAVIVTSSSEDPLYPDRARRTGACGFLAKHDLSGEALQRLVETARPRG